MNMVRPAAALLCALCLGPAPVLADEFQPIRNQSDFVEAVAGKHLTRVGIKLAVSPSGSIRGSAFGTPVTGAWDWNNGFFCRDLYFGTENLGANCQAVLISGTTMRFISDQGTGQWADLHLR